MESVSRSENRNGVSNRNSDTYVFTFDEEIDNPAYFKVSSKKTMDFDTFCSGSSKHLFIQHPKKRRTHFPSFF